MNIGVQYYRPPFPSQKYWEKDLEKIKDSGLDTLQFWVLWAWVESRPGKFDFDDYDRLVEMTNRHNLRLVISTIAEIQPCWIHREVPDSEMVDHMGHRVISSQRNECNFGLTPGGCTDNPDVWSRMSEFLNRVVTRYRSVDNIIGWDAWNELRWNVNGDGYLCYCRHTLEAFRKWLETMYGSLDELNNAWKRRYGCWAEVVPGKFHERPYTELMAWQHFITYRANQHGRARYDLIKGLDPGRIVTVHAGDPSPILAGCDRENFNYALNRGNDWSFADHLDGIGCSSFPRVYPMDDATFTARIEYVKSAARGKKVWLSELQGGGGALGFNISPAVDATSQQRWLWSGMASGADTILFWCWRDEVFGRESSGFGLAGNDGFANERLLSMKQTRKILERYEDVFASYCPTKAVIGVYFSPDSYYLHWAQDGDAKLCRDALEGYCRALVRQSIPYVVVESGHLDVLSGLKVLFLPRTIVMSAREEEAIIGFVRAGGIIVCESECGAYSPDGFYRYPEDRFLCRLMNGQEVGRRVLQESSLEITVYEKKTFTIQCSQWLTPWKDFSGTVWMSHANDTLAGITKSGQGQVIYCGTYLGNSYLEKSALDFEQFIKHCVSLEGYNPNLEVEFPQRTGESFVYVKTGSSISGNVAYVFFPEGVDSATLRISGKFFAGNVICDAISNRIYNVTDRENDRIVEVMASHWRIALLIDVSHC